MPSSELSRNAAFVTAAALLLCGVAHTRRECRASLLAAEERAVDATARADAAEAEAAEEEGRLRGALDLLSHAQKRDLGLAPLPPAPSSLVPSAGWDLCTEALAAVDRGYAKYANKKGKMTLISSFDAEGAESAWKGEVDALIAAHAARALPDLGARLREDPGLVLLLLEAPDCATTGALVAALPELAYLGHKICVPQADPHHYCLMVSGAGKAPAAGRRGEREKRNDSKQSAAGGAPADKGPSASCQAAMANRELERSGRDHKLQEAVAKALAAKAVAMAAGGGDEAVGCPLLLNVRQQRLDQWLSSNVGRGLRAAVAFFDYESSWFGRPKLGLSPLRDVQRFLRCGFAADECLLGLTLSFRAPHYSKYKGPQLAVADVADFVAAEAGALEFECTVLETVNYGMSFMLFLLTRRLPQ